MKKLVFFIAAAFFMLATGVQAQTQMCLPEYDYGSYAGISKVEMNGLVSESYEGDGYGSVETFEDFTADASRLFTVEAGQTYPMTVTFSNFGSGAGDQYYVFALFDWNNDLDWGNKASGERYEKLISAPATGGKLDVNFDVVVPADAVSGKVHMRAQAYYYESGFPINDLCSWFESGQLEDYLIEVSGGGTSVKAVDTKANEQIFANPVNDLVQFDVPVSQYSIYTIDGRMMSNGVATGSSVDVSNLNSGLYIMKAMTEKGVNVSQMIKR